MIGQIHLISNKKKNNTYSVKNSYTCFGRNKYCDIRIEEDNVAPKHCLILCKNGSSAKVRNLSSNNPTSINGSVLTGNHELKNNDIITIGSKSFEWTYFDKVSVEHEQDNKNMNKRKRVSEPLGCVGRLIAVVSPQSVQNQPLEQRDRNSIADVSFKEASNFLQPSKRRKTMGSENPSTSSQSSQISIGPNRPTKIPIPSRMKMSVRNKSQLASTYSNSGLRNQIGLKIPTKLSSRSEGNLSIPNKLNIDTPSTKCSKLCNHPRTPTGNREANMGFRSLNTTLRNNSPNILSSKITPYKKRNINTPLSLTNYSATKRCNITNARQTNKQTNSRAFTPTVTKLRNSDRYFTPTGKKISTPTRGKINHIPHGILNKEDMIESTSYGSGKFLRLNNNLCPRRKAFSTGKKLPNNSNRSQNLRQSTKVSSPCNSPSRQLTFIKVKSENLSQAETSTCKQNSPSSATSTDVKCLNGTEPVIGDCEIKDVQTECVQEAHVTSSTPSNSGTYKIVMRSSKKDSARRRIINELQSQSNGLQTCDIEETPIKRNSSVNTAASGKRQSMKKENVVINSAEGNSSQEEVFLKENSSSNKNLTPREKVNPGNSTNKILLNSVELTNIKDSFTLSCRSSTEQIPPDESPSSVKITVTSRVPSRIGNKQELIDWNSPEFNNTSKLITTDEERSPRRSPRYNTTVNGAVNLKKNSEINSKSLTNNAINEDNYQRRKRSNSTPGKLDIYTIPKVVTLNSTLLERNKQSILSTSQTENISIIPSPISSNSSKYSTGTKLCFKVRRSGGRLKRSSQLSQKNIPSKSAINSPSSIMAQSRLNSDTEEENSSFENERKINTTFEIVDESNDSDKNKEETIPTESKIYVMEGYVKNSSTNSPGETGNEKPAIRQSSLFEISTSKLFSSTPRNINKTTSIKMVWNDLGDDSNGETSSHSTKKKSKSNQEESKSSNENSGSTSHISKFGKKKSPVLREFIGNSKENKEDRSFSRRSRSFSAVSSTISDNEGYLSIPSEFNERNNSQFKNGQNISGTPSPKTRSRSSSSFLSVTSNSKVSAVNEVESALKKMKSPKKEMENSSNDNSKSNGRRAQRSSGTTLEIPRTTRRSKVNNMEISDCVKINITSGSLRSSRLSNITPINKSGWKKLTKSPKMEDSNKQETPKSNKQETPKSNKQETPKSNKQEPPKKVEEKKITPHVSINSPQLRRSSRRHISKIYSPMTTPKCASLPKRKAVTEIKELRNNQPELKMRRKLDALFLEKSKAAAKRLKAEPPKLLDKKKVAALLLCHKKKSPLKIESSQSTPQKSVLKIGQSNEQLTFKYPIPIVKQLRFANSTPPTITCPTIANRQKTPARKKTTNLQEIIEDEKDSTISSIIEDQVEEKKNDKEDDIFSALYLSRKTSLTTPEIEPDKPTRRLRSSVNRNQISPESTPSKTSKRVFFATPVADFSDIPSDTSVQSSTDKQSYNNIEPLEQSSPDCVYRNVSGLKKIFQVSPQPDYTKVSGVKRALEMTPQPDYTKVSGVKRVLEITPQPDYTKVSGVKRALEMTPQPDYTNVSGIQITPQPECSSNATGGARKTLQFTSESETTTNIGRNKRKSFQLSPHTADFTNVIGVQDLLTKADTCPNGSPKIRVFTTSPVANYTDVTGVKQIFTALPTADTKGGLKELFPADSNELLLNSRLKVKESVTSDNCEKQEVLQQRSLQLTEVKCARTSRKRKMDNDAVDSTSLSTTRKLRSTLNSDKTTKCAGNLSSSYSSQKMENKLKAGKHKNSLEHENCIAINKKALRKRLTSVQYGKGVSKKIGGEKLSSEKQLRVAVTSTSKEMINSNISKHTKKNNGKTIISSASRTTRLTRSKSKNINKTDESETSSKDVKKKITTRGKKLSSEEHLTVAMASTSQEMINSNISKHTKKNNVGKTAIPSASGTTRLTRSKSKNVCKTDESETSSKDVKKKTTTRRKKLSSEEQLRVAVASTSQEMINSNIGKYMKKSSVGKTTNPSTPNTVRRTRSKANNDAKENVKIVKKNVNNSPSKKVVAKLGVQKSLKIKPTVTKKPLSNTSDKLKIGNKKTVKGNDERLNEGRGKVKVGRSKRLIGDIEQNKKGVNKVATPPPPVSDTRDKKNSSIIIKKTIIPKPKNKQSTKKNKNTTSAIAVPSKNSSANKVLTSKKQKPRLSLKKRPSSVAGQKQKNNPKKSSDAKGNTKRETRSNSRKK